MLTAMKSESPLLFKISFISIIFFDTFIFLLAVARMGRMYCAKRLHRPHSSIISILLRDGELCTPNYACSEFHVTNVSPKAPCYMRKYFKSIKHSYNT